MKLCIEYKRLNVLVPSIEKKNYKQIEKKHTRTYIICLLYIHNYVYTLLYTIWPV